MTTNRPTTSEEAAKQEGYIQGRSDENYIQRNARGRDRAVYNAQVKESMGSGMIFGLVIAFLAVGLGGLFFFANRGGEEIIPVSVPDVEAPDVDVTVPEVEAPNVEVNVPEVELPDVEVPDVNVNEAPAAE